MKHVDIYTDGSCKGNPGPGGWEAILTYEKPNGEVCTKELTGYNISTTNNQMELTAVIEGLKALKCYCDVTVYSDSKYVVDAVNKGWLFSWKKNSWKKSDKKSVKNIELWEELLLLLAAGHNVHFTWVKGHDGNFYNERCDFLATSQC